MTISRDKQLSFKRFKFPSWDELQKDDWFSTRLNENFANIVMEWNYGCEPKYSVCAYINADHKRFENSELGYKEACKWLNDKKLELAKAFCD